MSLVSSTSTPVDVTATYSAIRASDLLAGVCSQYSIEKPLACHFLQQGINDTYHVQCAETEYSLRVYRHGLRKRDHIEFELAALDHLRLKGAAVAYPIERQSGGYITEIAAPEGIRYAIVTTHAEGNSLDFSEPENIRRFGASVANLHLMSDDFSTTLKRPRLELDHLLDESLDVIRACMNETDDNMIFFDKTANRLRSTLADSSIHDLNSGFCHGDTHGGNVHRNDEVLTHFDFDCCGEGYRAYDLATFYWNSRLSGNDQERWPAFIDSYKSVRHIDPIDPEQWDALTAIRHIWWMALIVTVSNDWYGLREGNFFDFQKNQINKLLRTEV